MSDLDGYKRVWAGPPNEKANFIYGIAREVSKHAELDACDHDLRELAKFFTVQDAVYLYEQIRDISKRLEFEWRDSFIQYFPSSRDSLPDMHVTQEEYERTHVDAIARSNQESSLNDLDGTVPF